MTAVKKPSILLHEDKRRQIAAKGHELVSKKHQLHKTGDYY